MFSKNRRDRKRTSHRSSRRRLSLETLERRRLLAVATDLANITGRVFDDFTGNGFDAGEQVSGATLDLYRGDGDAQFEPGSGDTEIRMTATDASGNYTFERLPAGQYFVLQPAQTINGRTLQRSVSPPITITAEQVAGRLIGTIDGFDQTFQSVIDNVSDGIPVTSTAAAPEAIGGSRDLLVDRTSDIGSVQLVVNDPVSPNLLQIASEAFGSGRRVVIWDGAGDDPAVVDDTGLGTIDLTNGGEAAGLRLVIGADLPSGAAVVRLYSSDGSTTSSRFSSATLNIPQLTTQPTSVEFLPFDQFTTPTGSTGAADLTNIGAIEFEVIAGPNYDALADLIGTIGPNIIPAPDFANFESIDLNLSKSLTTANPNVDQPVTFNLSLVNEGTDTATGIVVTDSLPVGITYQSNQPSTGSFNPGNGQWTIPSLAPGSTATLSLTGLLTTSTPQTNSAEVTAAEQFDVDSTPANANTTDEDDEATATVAPQVIDLSLDKSVSNALPNVGQPVTFTLTLNNTGPSPATNVVVADTLPNGLVLTDSNPSIGTFSNATSRWTIPVLTPGVPATLTLTTTVTSSGSFTNIAQVVAADQFDSDSTPNNLGQVISEDDEAQVSLQTPVADLSLTKTLVGNTATVGDNVTFVVTINNAGPNPATNVQVRDVLPSGLSFVNESTSLGDYNQSTGIWTIPNVPVTTGTSSPVTLTLTANLQNANVQTNTAEIIASDQFDPDSTPGNAVTSEDDIDSVVVTPITVDLNLTKTASQSRPRPGEAFTYTLTVNNTSSNEATGVVVTDVLPSGIIFQSATTGQSFSPGSGIWNVGTVAANSSRTIDIQAILNPNRTSPLDSITNTAEITDADQTDTDSTPGNSVAGEDDQASLVITPARADLRLNKTASGTQSNVGEEITFTISTTNDGPDPSGAITILDSNPTGANFVRSSASIGNYDSGSGRWTLPGLNNNQTATLSIVLQTTIAGSIDNVAQIIEATLPDPDSTPGNSVASEDDQDDASIQSQAIDLSLQKQVDNPTPRVGETFRYTVSVTNSGPDTATNIVVAEAIPDSISLVDSFPDTGSFVTSTRRWTIPTLASGTTTTLRLDTRINSIAGVSAGNPINTGLTNTAEIIDVDQFDIDSTPGNANANEDDQDSATVRVEIADISLTKTTLTPAPNVDELARFQLEVTNAGPDIATGLVIRDVLPDGLLLASAPPESRDPSAHAYLQRFAVDILNLFRPPNDPALGTQLISISTNDTAPDLIALYSASQLGKLKPQGLQAQAKDPAPIVKKWSVRAFQSVESELARIAALDHPKPAQQQPPNPKDFLQKSTTKKAAPRRAPGGMGGMDMDMGMDMGMDDSMMDMGMEMGMDMGMGMDMDMMGMGMGMGRMAPVAKPQPPEVDLSRRHLSHVLQQLLVGATGTLAGDTETTSSGLMAAADQPNRPALKEWVEKIVSVFTACNDDSLDTREKWVEMLQDQRVVLGDLAGLEVERPESDEDDDDGGGGFGLPGLPGFGAPAASKEPEPALPGLPGT